MFSTAHRLSPQTNRNQPCRCNSGRKARHCCTPTASAASPEFDLLLQQGIAQLHAGDPRQAAFTLATAIQLHPQSASATCNLGVALLRLGEPQRAIICYRKALALDPRFVAAYSNLGHALTELGHTDEAITALKTATSLDPTFVGAFINLGAALRILGRYPEAVAASQRALRLHPQNVDAHLNLGNASKEQGLLSQAAAAYRQAATFAPQDPRGYINLAESLRDCGEIASAAEAYQQALRIAPHHPLAYTNLLYLHAFTRDISPAQELALARRFEHHTLTPAERLRARRASHPDCGIFQALPLTHRPLRLGIVSAELGTHAVAEFLLPLLQHLNRKRIHLTLFATTNRHGERADRFREVADDFVSLAALSDPQACDLIRQHHIDVLLDTSGHTQGNRLGIFARRAAPVQVTYIGYWSTTGLTEMDYFLADPDPPPAIEAHFSEELWRLPRLGTCYRGDTALSLDWQPDPEGLLRLGSYNKFAKIREETIALWSLALAALPQAVLVLEDRGAHEDESHHRIRSGFSTHGIDPARIRFLPGPSLPDHERHMMLYNQLDIALDTVPFNSGTTAFDSLWMGVPLVTLEGHTMGGRIAAAALNALGRPEWVAQTPQHFATILQSLANTLPTTVEARHQQRQQLRSAMSASPLCNASTLALALEQALSAMYTRWLSAPAKMNSTDPHNATNASHEKQPPHHA